MNWIQLPKDEPKMTIENSRPVPESQQPSNLGCFLCTQLLSVTKHRVGLSQNQLRSSLYEKCRMLPAVFKDQCFSFVETSLPEIYFSLNYDFSTKDICVRLNLCDEKNPFAVGGPPPETGSETYQTTTVSPTTTNPRWTTTSYMRPSNVSKKAPKDRIGNKNMEVHPKEEEQNVNFNLENKQLTCNFCEKMLENAKNYAVVTKADIAMFANSACTKLPKGDIADKCYQLADKKIADLAKFVDQQVVEALWCAELNEC
ncbi:unnamed protein product [Auanema sp. JU1783]|nr:unnamed protein product [Auanema sp. JU1783]